MTAAVPFDHIGKDPDLKSKTQTRTRPNSLRRRVMIIVRLIRYALTALAVMRIFVRPTIIGREHTHTEGPVLFVGNHRSVFDPIANLGATKKRRDIAFLAKDSLFGLITGWVLRKLGHIPVARGTDAAREAADAGIVVLDAGGAVAVYIEGTIPRADKVDPKTGMAPPKTGPARMALASGATVVPVANVGTEQVKSPDTPWWRWGWARPYVIAFGPPIPVEKKTDMTPADWDALTAQIVEGLTDQIRTGQRVLAAKTKEKS